MPLTQNVRKLIPTLAFILAWTFLNVLMNVSYPAREIHLPALLKFSPEILAILALITATVWFGWRYHPALYLPLMAGVLFLRLFRIGEIVVPMYFFRPFNLFLDSRFVPDLIHLFYTTFPPRRFVLGAMLAATLAVGSTLAIWLALKTIHAYLSACRRRRFALALFLAVLLVLHYAPLGEVRIRTALFGPTVFRRVAAELDFILHVQGYRERHLGVIDAAIKKGAQVPSSLDQLQDTNVLLFFIESYGHTLFADQHHFSKVEPFLDRVARDLSTRGFKIVSTFLRSPTYGGTSWLAHATLAGGVRLDNHLNYNLLITSQAKTIARYFNTAGYRTVSAMPGTQWPWPEGAFFGYRQKYEARDFDYRGPSFGWSTMPDQYVLDFIRRREIQNQTRPLFIEFILVSSHAPFHRQPPFLEDWSLIGDGAIYYEKEAVTFPIVWPDLKDASDAYVAAMVYDLKVIADFIKQYIHDDTLIIILGDHQPNPQITGPDQPWSVPVHIISRKQRFLDPFQNRGYTRGLVPVQPPPHRGMETFLHEFLADFSTSTADKKPSSRQERATATPPP